MKRSQLLNLPGGVLGMALLSLSAVLQTSDGVAASTAPGGAHPRGRRGDVGDLMVQVKTVVWEGWGGGRYRLEPAPLMTIFAEDASGHVDSLPLGKNGIAVSSGLRAGQVLLWATGEFGSSVPRERADTTVVAAGTQTIDSLLLAGTLEESVAGATRKPIPDPLYSRGPHWLHMQDVQAAMREKQRQTDSVEAAERELRRQTDSIPGGLSHLHGPRWSE